jgi:hypothetical protein
MLRKTLIAIALLALASPAIAQDSGTKTPVTHKQTLSTSPVADILGFINGEYQRKVTESATLGVSAATYEWDDDDRYSNVMFLGRYYPQGAALTGFFIGGRIGAHRIDYETWEFNPNGFTSTTTKKTETRPAIGIDVGYEWLLGAKRNVVIGTGVGAMRLLGNSEDNFLIAFPTARLNVGFAF